MLILLTFFLKIDSLDNSADQPRKFRKKRATEIDKELSGKKEKLGHERGGVPFQHQIFCLVNMYI